LVGAVAHSHISDIIEFTKDFVVVGFNFGVLRGEGFKDQEMVISLHADRWRANSFVDGVVHVFGIKVGMTDEEAFFIVRNFQEVEGFLNDGHFLFLTQTLAHLNSKLKMEDAF